MSTTGVLRQLDRTPPNFRLARDSCTDREPLLSEGDFTISEEILNRLGLKSSLTSIYRQVLADRM